MNKGRHRLNLLHRKVGLERECSPRGWGEDQMCFNILDLLKNLEQPDTVGCARGARDSNNDTFHSLFSFGPCHWANITSNAARIDRIVIQKNVTEATKP
jgi:hypothetical protein